MSRSAANFPGRNADAVLYNYGETRRREFLKAGLTFLDLTPAVVRKSLTSSNDLTTLTLARASKLVRHKSVSPVELTRACLQKIEQLDPKLNAFTSVIGEQALAEAQELDAERRRGQWRGPLHGIPVAIKDSYYRTHIRPACPQFLRFPPQAENSTERGGADVPRP